MNKCSERHVLSHTHMFQDLNLKYIYTIMTCLKRDFLSNQLKILFCNFRYNFALLKIPNY